MHSCTCGPDTTIFRAGGGDSMMVKKTGTTLIAYLSAPAPLATQTISVGSFIDVAFRKL